MVDLIKAPVYIDFQRSMWISITGAGATPSYEAIEAMLVFDKAIIDDAVEMFEGMSQDVYVERGLSQWKKDLSRHANQLDMMRRSGIKEARAGKFEHVERDFLRPFLDGIWGGWVAKNYAGEPGGRPPQGDPVFPPSAAPETIDGKDVFVTSSYAADTASLWNQVYAAWSFDREIGAADRFGVIFNNAAAELERAAPGEDPTLRDKAVKVVRDAAEALNEGALNLLEAVGSGGLAVARWVGIGIGVYLLVRYVAPRIFKAGGER